MKRILLAVGATVLAAIFAGGRAVADPTFPDGDARRSMGNLLPGGPGQGPAADGPRRRFVPYYGHHRPYAGAYRHPYGWDSYGYGYDYLYPYPPPYPYPPYPYYPPPLYIPAEELYGPQAVRRFMGWDNWARPRVDVNIIAAPQKAGPPEEKKPDLRGTNQQSVALGWKFIGYGDAHFGNQKYTDAYQRYRKAVRAAPQLAEGYFRQGYALTAMGRYDLAARAIKRGLTLDPTWPRSEFRNDELYGGNQLAKKAHLDAMAKAAEEKPHDADLLFLLGVYLHFDGQPDRAVTFFERARQLAGGNDAHLRAFVGE